MSAVLKMYAVEFDGGFSRSFNLTDRPLGDDHLYQGIMLFDTLDKAQAEVDEENSENLNDDDEDAADDDFSATPVLLHPTGEIFDEFGVKLNPAISRQTGHSPQKVASDVRAFHGYQLGQLRKSLAEKLSEPGL